MGLSTTKWITLNVVFRLIQHTRNVLGGVAKPCSQHEEQRLNDIETNLRTYHITDKTEESGLESGRALDA